MKKRFLETGKITNTHGIRGEVRLQPWADEPASILEIKRLFIDERPYKVARARVQGNMVILKLDGVDDINAAMLLKNKTVFLDRCDVKLEDGAWFIQDAIGLPVFDEASGGEIGVLADIMDYPAGRVYSVKGETEHLIPEKGGFIRSVDIDGGRITVRLIEGM
ncbi:MAG: 16S rRNA processing protein RimM [Oscillospiraceae bacterium]|nr:16S rRNA processing protein RimM [Oscillospiraceae bacterium]